jgi:hypothetical protein
MAWKQRHPCRESVLFTPMLLITNALHAAQNFFLAHWKYTTIFGLLFQVKKEGAGENASRCIWIVFIVYLT